MNVQAPTKTRPIQQAHASGEWVAHSRGFEWLARAGFVARGLIYGIVGILAIKLAMGIGGTATNQQAALKTIAHQPFGKVLLILVAIGLAAITSGGSRVRSSATGLRTRAARVARTRQPPASSDGPAVPGWSGSPAPF